jgi:hypothetical protein
MIKIQSISDCKFCIWKLGMCDLKITKKNKLNQFSFNENSRKLKQDQKFH